GQFILGSRAVLGHIEAVRNGISIAVLSAMVALGLYLLLLARGHTRVVGSRIFVAMLFVSALRTLCVGDWLSRAGLPMTLMYRLEYLTLFLFPPLYAWLQRALFPAEVS